MDLIFDVNVVIGELFWIVKCCEKLDVCFVLFEVFEVGIFKVWVLIFLEIEVNKYIVIVVV